MAESAGSQVGVLLAQLGTPDAPTTSALRRYLAEFLWDPRVVNVSRPLWWCILHGIILRVRPGRSAALYRNIWTPEGSPLMVHSKRQAAGLQARMDARHPHTCCVALGMRYGKPSLPAALDELLQSGCRRVLLFPLYPQYSVATTASVMDSVLGHLLDRVDVPALRTVPPFPTQADYVAALAARVRQTLGSLSEPPDQLLISFHGEPESYREAGDPYHAQCLETGRALAAALDRREDEVRIVFQSRFGREPWLTPYLDQTLEELGKAGARRVVVVMPGFVADCLETLDEVGREGANLFRASGGGELAVVPCLNDDDEWLQAMTRIVEKELAGWI